MTMQRAHLTMPAEANLALMDMSVGCLGSDDTGDRLFVAVMLHKRNADPKEPRAAAVLMTWTDTLEFVSAVLQQAQNSWGRMPDDLIGPCTNETAMPAGATPANEKAPR